MENFKRSLVIREATKLEDNSFEISFSSELPYLRMFNKTKAMYEVLSHDPSCVDLSRASDGLSLLWAHDETQQIGRAENIAIDPVEKKGTATIRFGSSQMAQEKFNDVANGIIKDVSFGYEVRAYKEVNSQDSKYPTAVVTNWMPYEISLVSVPADATVGVGRSLEDGLLENTQAEEATETPEEETTEDSCEDSASEIEVNITVNINTTETPSEEASIPEEEKMKETCTKSISHIEENNMDNKELEVAPVTMPKSQEKTFETKDLRSYSIGKAINGILNGKLTGFEAEVGQEMSLRGYQPSTIPYEAFQRSTEMNFSTATAGQEMKVTEFGSYLEMLLTGSALQKLGVPVLNLNAPTTFPALDSVPTPTAKAETATGSAGAVVTRQVTFSPNILVSGFGVSRTALNYAPASLDSYLKTAIMKKHVQQFDINAITKLVTEITQTVAGNGTGTIADDIAKIMQLATTVADVTDLNDSCAYLTRNAVLNNLKLVQRAGSLAIPVATQNTILDWKAVSSANVAQVAAKDPIIFGDWSYAAFANFGGGVNIVTDIYGANAYSDSVSLVAQAHYDAHIMNTLAFAKMVTEVA